jgi:3',5'-cyclic AMP phosphodiesterase CpdA
MVRSGSALALPWVLGLLLTSCAFADKPDPHASAAGLPADKALQSSPSPGLITDRPPQPSVPYLSPELPADGFVIPDRALSKPPVFIVYGDMRFTDPSEKTAATPAARQALATKVASEHPDALFLTGDIPWHGGDTNDYHVFEEETVSWWEQHLRVYPVLGNHELSGCAETVCLENWWHAFPQFRERRWYAVAVGTKLRALALDSNASLLPGSEQRTWLEHELETLPADVRFVIVALHHPPVADDGFFIVRSNERSLARYLRSIAPRLSARILVCSGHVHNYERFEQHGVIFLVSGGGGAKPLAVWRGRSDRYQDRSFPNFHYIRFEVQDRFEAQGERLTAQMVRLMDYDVPTPHVWAIKDRFEVVAKPR